MSLFIDLVETFEIPNLTDYTYYYAKINGLVNSFPKLTGNSKFRTILPYKYPKSADDYVSTKFCIIGRVPVYGIYDKRDLQLIAVCVEGTLFAIDDCDLKPNLVPDLKFQRVRLNVKHSPFAVTKCLSYTKTSLCYAISTLSLGYTQQTKTEWTEAIVLLMGMTIHAVRLNPMKAMVGCGLYREGDAKNVPTLICLRLMNMWGQISEAIGEGEYPIYYKLHEENGELYSSFMYHHFADYAVALISHKSDKFLRRNDVWLGDEKSKRRRVEKQNKKKMKKMWIHRWLQIKAASRKRPETPTEIVKDEDYLLPTDSSLQGNGFNVVNVAPRSAIQFCMK